MSATRLRVYRVLLPEQQAKSGNSKPSASSCSAPVKNKFQVLVPKETVFLPRSARNRSVQFIPAKTQDAKAMLIIGPRHGTSPGPPIAVPLSPKDLGPWIPVEEKQGELATQGAGSMKLEGRFEQFDSDYDCDIIPFE
jgi:hypothetical protein